MGVDRTTTRVSSRALPLSPVVSNCSLGLKSDYTHWIALQSIQKSTGAVCGWRDAESGKLSCAYPEITGYALAYFASLNCPCEHVVGSGKLAASWLVSRLHGGNFSARDNWDAGAVYNFDIGIIAAGLMLWGRRFRDESCISLGVALVKGLRDQIRLFGYLPPLSAFGPSSLRDTTWSTSGNAHLLKVVQCLLLAESYGLESSRDAALTLINGGKREQLPSGCFVTHPGDNEVFLHPLLYAAEGMWIWGTAENDRDAVDRAQAVVEWARQHQMKTGGFPRSVFKVGVPSLPIEQSDVTCQVARLARCLDDGMPLLDSALERIRQVSWGGEGAGGVLYQPDSGRLDQNTWATMFAAQAVQAAARPRDALSWHELV